MGLMLDFVCPPPLQPQRGPPMSIHYLERGSPIIGTRCLPIIGTRCLRAPSPECQPHSRNKGARRSGVNRSGPGCGKDAAGILYARCRVDGVGNVVRGSHVGLVEHVLDLEEEDRALEIVICNVRVVVNVEIDQAIARRLQEVGVLHVERVEPYVLHEGAHPFPRPERLIISKTCKKLLRGDARDLVSGAVEPRRERAGARPLFRLRGS
jgi:hypothetical protein